MRYIVGKLSYKKRCVFAGIINNLVLKSCRPTKNLGLEDSHLQEGLEFGAPLPHERHSVQVYTSH